MFLFQKILSLPEVRSSVVTHLIEKGRIVLTDVTAKWDVGMQDNTLSNITMKIEPGSLVAIVGPVGSGKVNLHCELNMESSENLCMYKLFCFCF